jgi:hypothetical protein
MSHPEMEPLQARVVDRIDTDETLVIDRRAVLAGLLGIVGAVASTSTLLRAQRARAAENCQGTTPKAALKYRDQPNGDQQCSNCLHFCPGASTAAMGTCQVVQGQISPHGYCIAWAKKPG